MYINITKVMYNNIKQKHYDYIQVYTIGWKLAFNVRGREVVEYFQLSYVW